MSTSKSADSINIDYEELEIDKFIAAPGLRGLAAASALNRDATPPDGATAPADGSSADPEGGGGDAPPTANAGRRTTPKPKPGQKPRGTRGKRAPRPDLAPTDAPAGDRGAVPDTAPPVLPGGPAMSGADLDVLLVGGPMAGALAAVYVGEDTRDALKVYATVNKLTVGQLAENVLRYWISNNAAALRQRATEGMPGG